MTDGPPADLVGILRKLYFYSHVHIPNEGKVPSGPNHFVKLHGVLPEREWERLKKWLADDASKSDAGGNPEPSQ